MRGHNRALLLFQQVLKSERGNVESALALIPLLTLFLVVTQINVAIHGRSMLKITAQDQASTRAISGEFLPNDSFLNIYSPDPHQNLELVITHKKRGLPQLIGQARNIDVTGIAIVESKR